MCVHTAATCWHVRCRQTLFCWLLSIVSNDKTQGNKDDAECSADFLNFTKLPGSHGRLIFQSLLQSAEKHLVFTNICCLPKQVTAPEHVICINSGRQHVIHCFCGFLLFCRGHRLSRRSFTAVQDTFVFRLLWICGHMWPRSHPMWPERLDLLNVVH